MQSFLCEVAQKRSRKTSSLRTLHFSEKPNSGKYISFCRDGEVNPRQEGSGSGARRREGTCAGRRLSSVETGFFAGRESWLDGKWVSAPWGCGRARFLTVPDPAVTI